MAGTRWVVLVKPPDDHPGAVRIFGPFRERVRADALRDKVRAVVDAKSWADRLSVTDEATGYAYTLELEAPRVRVASWWARIGEYVSE